MLPTDTRRFFRIFLYGGGSALLLLNLFFLLRATFSANFVPIVPLIAGIFTAAGLLFIVHAEEQARRMDKQDHRRISRVAHQLTNPLKTLKSDIQKLIDGADKLPAEQRLQLKRMSTKSKVLLDNIRDVFLTLQAGEGAVSQDTRLYDLCALVDEVRQRTAPLASAHNVSVTYKAHCSKALVKVDRRLFFIALTHLIENAILYTRTPGLVNIAVTRDKKRVRVIVQDRGIGITRNDAPLVLHPFARGETASQYDPDGIGVGLALSQLIVKEFGGQLHWSHKAKGAGSQFEIHLPLAG